MTRKLRTCVLVGLLPGEFPVPVSTRWRTASPIHGSFGGTREDMAGALAYAADGKVIADIELQPLSAINGGLDRLDHGDVASRVVLEFSDNRGERPYYDKFASYKGRSLDIRQVEASSFLRTYSFNSETSP